MVGPTVRNYRFNKVMYRIWDPFLGDLLEFILDIFFSGGNWFIFSQNIFNEAILEFSKIDKANKMRFYFSEVYTLL